MHYIKKKSMYLLSKPWNTCWGFALYPLFWWWTRKKEKQTEQPVRFTLNQKKNKASIQKTKIFMEEKEKNKIIQRNFHIWLIQCKFTKKKTKNKKKFLFSFSTHKIKSTTCESFACGICGFFYHKIKYKIYINRLQNSVGCWIRKLWFIRQCHPKRWFSLCIFFHFIFV